MTTAEIVQEEELVCCDECNDSFKVDNMSEVHDGDIVCEGCVLESYSTCCDCGSLYRYTDIQYYDSIGDYICNACFDDNYSLCEDCEDCVHNEDLYHRGDRYLCNSCVDDYCPDCESHLDYCECDCNSIDAYERDAKNIPLHQKIYKVGVEIEVDGVDDNEGLSEQLPESVGIKSDGSLSSGGVEIITPPLLYGLHSEIIDTICNTLQQQNAIINTKTGLHIHISKDMEYVKSLCKVVNYERCEKIYIENIAKVFSKIEGFLYTLVSESRRNNRYCSMIGNDYINYKRYKKKSKYQDSFDNYLSSRYYGINVKSYKKHNTVEIRLHNGTVNSEKIKNWISLLIGCFDVVDDELHRCQLGYGKKHLDIIFSSKNTIEFIDNMQNYNYINNAIATFYKERYKILNT